MTFASLFKEEARPIIIPPSRRPAFKCQLDSYEFDYFHWNVMNAAQCCDVFNFIKGKKLITPIFTSF
ncbi:hypothetical protein T4E_10187 [Trichinella pseudospiralis]|uniref:Uncharacterized protein n=1 Tax=Trichinella pseudospiralis TaxID=6337 RepID=A0A0V0Y7T8_TRIPS|nr:hypothetical protein T4E_10187 [Trichinella pseudospiralis]